MVGEYRDTLLAIVVRLKNEHYRGGHKTHRGRFRKCAKKSLKTVE